MLQYRKININEFISEFFIFWKPIFEDKVWLNKYKKQDDNLLVKYESSEDKKEHYFFFYWYDEKMYNIINGISKPAMVNKYHISTLKNIISNNNNKIKIKFKLVDKMFIPDVLIEYEENKTLVKNIDKINLFDI